MECEANMNKPYARGFYNKFDDKEQWIRISEGCPNKCPFCRESWENPEIKMLSIPEIVRNNVKILDMNLLCHKEALETIKFLGNKKVNNKFVYFELICGIDYRFLTPEIAKALKESRFKNLRIAWDFEFSKQILMQKTLKNLLKAGYYPRDITIFMVCNWRTSYEENCRKLDLCKVWNVKVADCWFDNQISPNIKSVYWNTDQIKDFRRKCRKHNQIVRFKIDPECFET